ncbi:DUF4097 family beta strand repeat-containing protein [Streptomyces sp. NPDC057638]|uniref:DUF4097 family beta strand repeat-containing protein n=1 Tax=Streptomyces sp. NPDC057638 TaxID=3346190 RepID=UPI0036BDA786
MRQQQLRYVGIYVVASLVVGGMSAYGLVKRHSFKDREALSGPISSVRIENGPGGVVLRGTRAGTPLQLRRTVEYKGDRPSGVSHRLTDGVLVLGGCGDRCSVRYRVDVPEGVPVSGETSGGAVALSRVGAVKVSTHTGGIALDGVLGAVDVRATNGRITGTRLYGREIAAETSNGSIDLAPAAPSDIRATSATGDITVTVPRAAYQVTAESKNGERRIDVAHEPLGAWRLGLDSGGGDVTVRARMADTPWWWGSAR